MWFFFYFIFFISLLESWGHIKQGRARQAGITDKQWLRICSFSQQLCGCDSIVRSNAFRAPFWLLAECCRKHFSLCCLCSSVTGTAGLTAQVYRAVFSPHPVPGLQHDSPFPIFSLPISDSFCVSFYIQKGMIQVQERSELLLQLCAAHTKTVCRYLSLT